MDIPRTLHDLTHMSFMCGRVGRLQTISVVPCLPGDGAEFDIVGAIRMSPLRRGMAVDSVVDILTFYVPHRHCYDNWMDFITEGWDESETLSTESVGLGVTCLGMGDVDTGSVPLFYPQGYRNIWNNYFRPPTTIAERTDAISAWSDDDRRFGFRCAYLKNMWTTIMAQGVASSDYNVAVNAGNVSLLDIAQQRGYLRTEQERAYFDTRYRDLISDFGGHTTIDADDRPQLLMRSTLWASGYDVDGTSEVSLGQFSGRVVQSFRHRVPRFYCGEHGALWTVMLLRFPNIHEDENPFFVNNPNPTYAQFAGDPEIFATQPPYGLRLSDVFSDSADNTVRGYIPFGQWYRYQPNVVHANFDNLNGFPFLNTIPSSVTDMVLCDSEQFNEIYQTTQLGHYQVHARINAPFMRRLPPASSSLKAGG